MCYHKVLTKLASQGEAGQWRHCRREELRPVMLLVLVEHSVHYCSTGTSSKLHLSLAQAYIRSAEGI